MKHQLSREAILETNPRVDATLVRQSAELRQELQRVGIRARPSFRLLPPLGTALQTLLHNASPARRDEDTRHIAGVHS